MEFGIVKTNQEVCDFFIDIFNKEPDGKISKFIEDLYDEILVPDVYTATGAGCDNMSVLLFKLKSEILFGFI